MANMFSNAITALWNAAGTTYYVIKINVTNAASAAASRILDLQVAAASKFSVDVNGHVRQAGNHYMPAAGVIDFGGDVTITHSTDILTMVGAFTLDMQYSDEGAGYNPEIILHRISASPAASDSLGQVTWRGRDSAANAQDYAGLVATIIDPTSGSEDAQLLMKLVAAGTMRNSHYFAYSTYQNYWADSGSSAGPIIEMKRDSASPAVTDDLGRISFLGNNSAAVETKYADITCRISDPTSTQEDGNIYMRVLQAGALNTVLQIGMIGTAAPQIAMTGIMTLDSRQTVTLSSGGSIGITSSYVGVDTFAAAAIDNLDDIFVFGGVTPSDGMVVTLVAVSSSRNVIVRHNVGASANSNIITVNAANITLGSSSNTMTFVFRSGLGWLQMAGKAS